MSYGFLKHKECQWLSGKWSVALAAEQVVRDDCTGQASHELEQDVENAEEAAETSMVLPEHESERNSWVVVGSRNIRAHDQNNEEADEDLELGALRMLSTDK